jgi:nitrogen-specific signal transduction histidine kinase
VEYPEGNLQQIRQLGHELRNALTSVLTAAEIVKRRCGETVESEHEVITRQVYRMRKVVDEMLTLVGRTTPGTTPAPVTATATPTTDASS